MGRIHKVTAQLAAAVHAHAKAMHEKEPADHHQQLMDDCEKVQSDCDKAAIADGLEKSRQDRIDRDNAVTERVPGLSRVAPNAPGIVGVPRGGQPTTAAKPVVPLAFQKLCESPDEEEQMTGIR
jgi:hypothetical protein